MLLLLLLLLLLQQLLPLLPLKGGVFGSVTYCWTLCCRGPTKWLLGDL